MKHSLLESYPEFCLEWDYKRNSPLLPSDVLPHSNKYAWWKCSEGHSWRAKINNRTSHFNRCPYCSGALVILGKTDLASVFPDIAAEWHPTKNENLKPTDVSIKSNRSVVWLCKKGHEWTTKVYHRTDGSGCPYCAGQLPIKGTTDLATVRPLLAKEWHSDKNRHLTPSDFTAFSHKKVWWRDRYGHEWYASIFGRSNGIGCPICSRHTIMKGENDLLTVIPELAAEWDYEKNGAITPDSVTPHSNKSVWWKGTCGHSWKAKIDNRANGTGCPYCKQNRLISGQTSLDAINPLLALEWHPSKNGQRTPHNTSAFCNDAVWWMCEHGHEWRAVVSNRSYGERCPYCSGRRPIIGVTDFATISLKLVAEWHPTKNGLTKPSDIAAFSNFKYWWLCSEGHEWQATAATRSYGSGCPYCNSNRLIVGKNDFATRFPDLVSEWHPHQNDPLKPSDITVFSNIKVWWMCNKGHEWQASVSSRSHGSGCPYCNGRTISIQKII